jgi:hypothetical protein
VVFLALIDIQNASASHNLMIEWRAVDIFAIWKRADHFQHEL